MVLSKTFTIFNFLKFKKIATNKANNNKKWAKDV